MSVPILNERHAVHTLVQQWLMRSNTTLHPNIQPSIVRFSLACAGVGLDHLSAEQAMVFCDESLRGKFMSYWLFTDRRLIGCLGETRIDVRYSQIAQMQIETGLLKRVITAQMSEGNRKEVWGSGELWEPHVKFFEAIYAMPPAQREPPPRPLCPAREGDPTGAITALEWLGTPDDRTALMLRYLEAAARTGVMSVEIARDFVARVVLHHRTLHFGRGMAQGRWTSAVGANDLANLMVQTYGAPLSHSETPVRTLELGSQMRSNAVAKAALSTAVGLASLAVLGVGWTQTAKSPPPRFKIMMADTPPFASFRLQGPRGAPLERESPELLHQIDCKLLELEDAVLTRRLVRGWGEKTPELLAVDEREVLREMARVAGGAGPAPGRAASSDGERAQVHGFVSDTSGMSMEDARVVQDVAQAVLASGGPISDRINAAARLMTAGDYDGAAAAYHAIAEASPAERGTCWSQVGAALYFLGRYEEAIQWYTAAAGEGADEEMMKMNVEEAQEAIARRR